MRSHRLSMGPRGLLRSALPLCPAFSRCGEEGWKPRTGFWKVGTRSNTFMSRKKECLTSQQARRQNRKADTLERRVLRRPADWGLFPVSGSDGPCVRTHVVKISSVP